MTASCMALTQLSALRISSPPLRTARVSPANPKYSSFRLVVCVSWHVSPAASNNKLVQLRSQRLHHSCPLVNKIEYCGQALACPSFPPKLPLPVRASGLPPAPKLPLPVWASGLPPSTFYFVPWSTWVHTPQWHLDQLSGLCNEHGCDWPTDRQTHRPKDRPRCCSNSRSRLMLCRAVRLNNRRLYKKFCTKLWNFWQYSGKQNNYNTQPPFHGHYTCQPALAGTSSYELECWCWKQVTTWGRFFMWENLVWHTPIWSRESIAHWQQLPILWRWSDLTGIVPRNVRPPCMDLHCHVIHGSWADRSLYLSAAVSWTAFTVPLSTQTVQQQHTTESVSRQRKCADTIGTVPVPCAGHFQC